MAYKNPEDLIAYRKAHRAEANERARLWRLAHPGANAAKAREWRAKNKTHAAEVQRRYRAANREKLREAQRRWRERTGYAHSEKRKTQNLKDGLRVHGLSVAQYRELLAEQGGACAICRATKPRMKGAKRFYVDHCHVTDRIRGLLCFRCNSMLGCADDSSVTLRRAAEYLEAPNDRSLVRGEGRRLLGS